MAEAGHDDAHGGHSQAVTCRDHSGARTAGSNPIGSTIADQSIGGRDCASCDLWLAARVDHVADVEAAIVCYCGTLGLEQRTGRPDFGFGGTWLDADAHQVHVIEGTTPPGHGQHLALLVDRLDETVVELRAHGVEVSGPRPVGSSRQATLSDPTGKLIELHEAG